MQSSILACCFQRHYKPTFWGRKNRWADIWLDFLIEFSVVAANQKTRLLTNCDTGRLSSNLNCWLYTVLFAYRKCTWKCQRLVYSIKQEPAKLHSLDWFNFPHRKQCCSETEWRKSCSTGNCWNLLSVGGLPSLFSLVSDQLHNPGGFDISIILIQLIPEE